MGCDTPLPIEIDLDFGIESFANSIVLAIPISMENGRNQPVKKLEEDRPYQPRVTFEKCTAIVRFLKLEDVTDLFLPIGSVIYYDPF